MQKDQKSVQKMDMYVESWEGVLKVEKLRKQNVDWEY